MTDATQTTVRGLRVPLLLVHGSLDFNVPISDLALFQSWAAPSDTVVALDGLTHAFNEVSAAGYDQEVSAQLLDSLTDWLTSQIRSRELARAGSSF